MPSPLSRAERQQEIGEGENSANSTFGNVLDERTAAYHFLVLVELTNVRKPSYHDSRLPIEIWSSHLEMHEKDSTDLFNEFQRSCERHL
jgi:hypothetical protein